MPEKKIVALDSQRLDAIQTCMQLYDYKFNQHLVPINTANYLEKGSLIHHMMSEYYSLAAARELNYKDRVQACVTAGREEALNMSIDIAEVELCVATFMQYTELWENDAWNDIVGVEQVGSKILYDSNDLTILYEVKMDLIIRLNGKLVPVDHKTASSRRDPNQLSNQFKGYCWFLSTCNNLIVNEIGLQKTVKPVDKFRRHLLSFPDSIIEEWRQNTIQWVEYALSCGASVPRNFTSCDKFSGCDFKHICIAEPGDLREFRLRKDFKFKPWDIGSEHL